MIIMFNTKLSFISVFKYIKISKLQSKLYTGEVILLTIKYYCRGQRQYLKLIHVSLVHLLLALAVHNIES